MRRSKTQNISEVISELLKKYGHEEKLAEVRLIQSWEEILGRTVNRYTKKIYLKDRILYVHLSSPVVKNELMLIRDEVIRQLNEKAGKKMVEKIIFR